MVWQLTGGDRGARLVQPRPLDLEDAVRRIRLSRPSTWERHPSLPVLYRREGRGTRILLFESDDQLDEVLEGACWTWFIRTRPVPPADRAHFEGLE